MERERIVGIFKFILGVLVASQIFPLAFIGLTYIKGDIEVFGYWTPYLAGLLIDGVFVFLVGLYHFLLWCFDSY